MNTQKKSTSERGHSPTLSSIAREEARYAFDNKLITHNQYAINVALNAPSYFCFSPVTGEDVENCAELLCRNESTNRRRIERYIIDGEKFDKNLVPALIKSLPEGRRAVAKQRILAAFDFVSDDALFDFTDLKMASVKESSEAIAAIASGADLAIIAKEIAESIEASNRMLAVVRRMMAGGAK